MFLLCMSVPLLSSLFVCLSMLIIIVSVSVRACVCVFVRDCVVNFESVYYLVDVILFAFETKTHGLFVMRFDPVGCIRLA